MKGKKGNKTSFLVYFMKHLIFNLFLLSTSFKAKYHAYSLLAMIILLSCDWSRKTPILWLIKSSILKMKRSHRVDHLNLKVKMQSSTALHKKGRKKYYNHSVPNFSLVFFYKLKRYNLLTCMPFSFETKKCFLDKIMENHKHTILFHICTIRIATHSPLWVDYVCRSSINL